MFIHIAAQKHGTGIRPPGTAKVCLARFAFPGEVAGMKHQPMALLPGRVGSRVPATAGIHEQGAALKPAAVGPEDKINIALNEAVFKILAAVGGQSPTEGTHSAVLIYGAISFSTLGIKGPQNRVS